KDIKVKYAYVFHDKADDILQKYHPDLIDSTNLHTVSKSAYLPDDTVFTIYFTDAASTILKRNLLGMILSFVLVGAVVACLFWLLTIIKKQKQLAELKNDLISNITHEFKTPIATIGVALEGIQNFNRENDPVKTEKYLNTSTTHLKKLSMMVEKILETATLDSDELPLNREEIDLDALLRTLVGKYQNLHPDKKMTYQSWKETLKFKADAFHLENAMNNLLDNAVKYGGDEIDVLLGSQG